LTCQTALTPAAILFEPSAMPKAVCDREQKPKAEVLPVPFLFKSKHYWHFNDLAGNDQQLIFQPFVLSCRICFRESN